MGLVKSLGMVCQTEVKVAENDSDVVLVNLVELVQGAAFLLKRFIADLCQHLEPLLSEISAYTCVQMTIQKTEGSIRNPEPD